MVSQVWLAGPSHRWAHTGFVAVSPTLTSVPWKIYSKKIPVKQIGLRRGTLILSGSSGGSLLPLSRALSSS